MAKHRKSWLDGAWVAHRLELRTSLAWNALPWSARLFIDQLEVELMQHGGTNNGRLVCTYDKLEALGQDRRATAVGIVYAEHLGIVVNTQRGRRAAGEHHLPSTYRLTFLPVKTGEGYERPTDEWKLIGTPEQLKARLNKIERELAERHERAAAKWKIIKARSAQRKRFSGRKNAPGTGCENAPGEPNVSGCENAPTGLGAKMHLPSKSPGGDARLSPSPLRTG